MYLDNFMLEDWVGLENLVSGNVTFRFIQIMSKKWDTDLITADKEVYKWLCWLQGKEF